jgi:hypothetical protein
MRCIPQKFFTWREPQDFVAARCRAEWASLAPRERRILRGAALFLPQFPWLLSFFVPLKVPSLVLGLATSFFLFWCLPILWLKTPAHVHVFEDCILWQSGNSHRRFLFTELASYHWQSQGVHSVLKLIRKSGKEFDLALSGEVDELELDRFLAERVDLESIHGL